MSQDTMTRRSLIQGSAGLAAATAQLNARGAFFAAELIPRPSDELVALVLRPAPFNLSPNLLRGA